MERHPRQMPSFEEWLQRSTKTAIPRRMSRRPLDKTTLTARALRHRLAHELSISLGQICTVAGCSTRCPSTRR